MSTLFRNLVGSIPNEQFLSLKETLLINTLESEIEIINGLFSNKLNVVYYHSDYKEIQYGNLVNFVKIRKESTQYKQYYKSQEFKTLNHFYKNYKTTSGFVFTSDNLKHIPDISRELNVLIFTHIPYDLLNHNLVNNLDLIESHTGVLKKKNLYYTKFYPLKGKILNSIPFNKLFLWIFGDHVMYSPQSYKLREKIVDLSISYKWSHLTTMERIKQCFEVSNDYDLKLLLEYSK